MNQTSTPADALNATFRKFTNTLSPQLKARMNGRLERGLQIAQAGGVTPYKDPYSPDSQRLFKVKSSNPSKPPYLVDLSARTCTCPDHWKGHYCKHRVAAQVFEMSGSKPNPPQPSNGKTPTKPLMEEHIDSDSLIWACLR
jgi:uncharacterized Zn finger protein